MSTSGDIGRPLEDHGGAQEPSATQSPLNSRRFSNRIFIPYTIPSTAPIAVGRDGGSAVSVLGWQASDEGCSPTRSKPADGAKFLTAGTTMGALDFRSAASRRPAQPSEGKALRTRAKNRRDTRGRSKCEIDPAEYRLST
jgi:hypothetical protein